MSRLPIEVIKRLFFYFQRRIQTTATFRRHSNGFTALVTCPPVCEQIKRCLSLILLTPPSQSIRRRGVTRVCSIMSFIRHFSRLISRGSWYSSASFSKSQSPLAVFKKKHWLSYQQVQRSLDEIQQRCSNGRELSERAGSERRLDQSRESSGTCHQPGFDWSGGERQQRSDG